MSEALKRCQLDDKCRKLVVNIIIMHNASDAEIRTMLDNLYPELRWSVGERLWKIRGMVERGHWTVA